MYSGLHTHASLIFFFYLVSHFSDKLRCILFGFHLTNTNDCISVKRKEKDMSYFANGKSENCRINIFSHTQSIFCRNTFCCEITSYSTLDNGSLNKYLLNMLCYIYCCFFSIESTVSSAILQDWRTHYCTTTSFRK